MLRQIGRERGSACEGLRRSRPCPAAGPGVRCRPPWRSLRLSRRARGRGRARRHERRRGAWPPRRGRRWPPQTSGARRSDGDRAAAWLAPCGPGRGVVRSSMPFHFGHGVHDRAARQHACCSIFLRHRIGRTFLVTNHLGSDAYKEAIRCRGPRPPVYESATRTSLRPQSHPAGRVCRGCTGPQKPRGAHHRRRRSGLR